jgi:hypothetical protein
VLFLGAVRPENAVIEGADDLERGDAAPNFIAEPTTEDDRGRISAFREA